MLKQFFTFLKRQNLPLGVAPLPDLTRIYAVGDIHGRADLLDQMHDLIAMDAETVPETTEKIIVYMGDYVDRGPDSKKVLDTLIHHPLQGYRLIFLMGNHDRMMLDFLNAGGIAALWARHGGLETLASYGFYPSFDALVKADYIEDLRTRFDKEVPLIHKAFLENLKQHYEIGGYYFVHAGVHPDVPLDRQMQHDALWMREPFLASDKRMEKIIVHGHTPVRHPEPLHNRIPVDSGAVMTGVLSAAVLDGHSVRFLHAYE